jgi:hypothetical protein
LGGRCRESTARRRLPPTTITTTIIRAAKNTPTLGEGTASTSAYLGCQLLAYARSPECRWCVWTVALITGLCRILCPIQQQSPVTEYAWNWWDWDLINIYNL